MQQLLEEACTFLTCDYDDTNTQDFSGFQPQDASS